MKWFKMESSIYENAKVQSLDLPVLKTWLNLLGIYARYESFPSLKQIAYITRQSLEDLTAHVESLVRDELVDRDPDGTIRLHNWEDYNPYECSTERVKKHRAMKQVKHVSSVSNVSSTTGTPHLSGPALETDSCRKEILLNGAAHSEKSQQVLANESVEPPVGSPHETVKQMEQMKHLRVEKSREEEIRKEENTLSHPYPLSPAVAGQAKPENGASALLKSSNGKTPEYKLDAFSEWAHDVYNRHPKQKNQFAVLHALKQTFAGKAAEQQLFDENHALWIAYWQLDSAYPRFVPVLAEPNGGGWINDQAWRKKPPPPPVADTKHARAKAWADQFKGETQ